MEIALERRFNDLRSPASRSPSKKLNSFCCNIIRVHYSSSQDPFYGFRAGVGPPLYGNGGIICSKEKHFYNTFVLISFFFFLSFFLFFFFLFFFYDFVSYLQFSFLQIESSRRSGDE